MTENSREIEKSTSDKNISWWDVLASIFALVLNIARLFVDLYGALLYYEAGDIFSALTTASIFPFSCLIIQGISVHWLCLESSHKLSCIFYASFPSLATRLTLLLKEWHLVNSKNRSESSSESTGENLERHFSDLRLLFLFDAFLHSIPQLVLQLYIASTSNALPSSSYTVAMLSVNVISIVNTLVLYGKGESGSRGGWAVAIYVSWRFGMLTARISAFVMLLIVFKLWFLLFIGVHWVTMFVWVSYKLKDGQCKMKRGSCSDSLCCGMTAILFCYCFFNLDITHSPGLLVSFYALIFLQNLTCLTGFLMFYDGATSLLAISFFICVLGGTFIGSVCLLLYYRFYQEPASNSLLCQLPTLFSRSAARDQQGRSSVEIQVANVENCDPQTFSDSKLALGDSVVIYEEPFMEDIDNVHKWIQEASNQSAVRECISPGTDEGGSSVFSAHDYENLAAVNIARAGGLTMWKGYSDIATYVHDDSVGRTNASTVTTTTSQDYLDAIADDYADCKTQSSLQTIPEESENSICSNAKGLSLSDACTLVATIDQIRVATPMQEERFSLVRRTFSVLRERFEGREQFPLDTWESDAAVPSPLPVSRARTTFSLIRERFEGVKDVGGDSVAAVEPRETPTKFNNRVKDMGSFFLKQVLTPPKMAAFRRKKIFSPNSLISNNNADASTINNVS